MLKRCLFVCVWVGGGIGWFWSVRGDFPHFDFFQDISKFLKLEAALGSGGYAEVFRGVAKQGNLEKYAVKVVNKKQADRGLLAQLRKEVAIHRKLVHKRVVQLVDAYESKTKMYLVLELVDGGMLLDRLITAKKFMEQDARRVMKQLLDGLNYLHSQGVAHRDLKLDNILCTSTKELEVKIADFGLSSLSGTNTKEAESANDGTLRPMRSFVGTPVYMAPEITGSTDYDQSVDMWALGVILYALLCGEFPSTTEDTRKPKEWKVSFPQQSWATVSNEAKDLVTKLLQVDAKHRLSAQDALKHRWFSSNTQFGSDVDLGVNFERLRLEEVEESKRMRKYVNLIRALSRWKNFAHLSPLAVHLEDQHFDSIDEDDDEYPSGNK